MKLVVTGSRRGHPSLRPWLLRWVDRFGHPSLAIVGDNDDTEDSVDKRAFEFFVQLGCNTLKVCVNSAAPSPQRFHDRNQRMVNFADPPDDWLLAFPDSESRGTWDCLRRGQARGLVCMVAKSTI